MSLENQIKQKALELGFDLVGITDADRLDDRHVAYFKKWLDDGNHGQMNYLNRHLAKRIAPSKLLPNAKSIIVTACNFKPKEADIKVTAQRQKLAKISAYAQNQDYHIAIKNKLNELAKFIKDAAVDQADYKFKLCVDSVPILEKAVAVKAGLGFIGKNHLLINPEFGCQLFLGEIVTTLELAPDDPMTIDRDRCGDCTECIKNCPTGALSADGSFDARKCISYLTVESDSDVSQKMKNKMDNWVFGCDICSEVCPYTKKSQVATGSIIKRKETIGELTPDQIIDMSPKQFDEMFADTAIKRTGLKKLKKNAEICLENYKACKFHGK